MLALLLTCSGLCGLGCRQTFEVIYKKLEKELHERKKEMVNVLVDKLGSVIALPV